MFAIINNFIKGGGFDLQQVEGFINRLLMTLSTSPSLVHYFINTCE